MLRQIQARLFTLAAIASLAVAGTANAAIDVDFEWSGGGNTTTASVSSTVSMEIFVTATGDTSISGYQFTITWDSSELSYIDNPPVGNTVPGTDDSAFNTGPQFARNGTWTNGGAGELFLTSGGLPGFYSSSTLTTPTDDITPADGKVSVGTIQFHVTSTVASDGTGDVGGCYDCVQFAGDGSVGTGDLTTNFNGAGVNAAAGSVCGDGTTDADEECDDGNNTDGDGCDATCDQEALCGDGNVDPGEQCDDGNNASGDGCSATCNLEGGGCGNDTTPPHISGISASPNVLWPPNHKMVSVDVAIEASDLCDPAPTCQIISVESSEPATGPGYGNTTPDAEIAGDLALELRAERSGGGGGRVYTAIVECTDASGNSSSEDVSVAVPESQKK